ncbi:MAG: hypothetical protein H6774_02195 [Pseudomonadales bacterium]|nr:hypothetical protein [Candidatus Woesebacteria bacterium]MCB9801878.1 hypothetical protein [Pseudomonadales bacterium]
MRTTTEKLLLLTYPSTQEARGVPLDTLALLLPDHAPEGRRSLLYYLEKQGYVSLVEAGETRQIILLDRGTRHVHDRFPSFSTNNDQEWVIVMFRTAPKADAQFRYLRSLLMQRRAACIQSGVYLLPSNSFQTIQRELQVKYDGSVLVAEVGRWIFGSSSTIGLDYFHLNDALVNLSSISRDINTMLEKINSKKRLTSKVKMDYLSIVDRYYAVVDQDSGATKYCFPESKGVGQVLVELQNLHHTLSYYYRISK